MENEKQCIKKNVEYKIGKEEMSQFIPHREKMSFLDGIIDWADDLLSIKTGALIGKDHLFYNEEQGGVPVIAAFEYMAQSAAVLSGLTRHLKGDSTARVGFLISVRNFKAEEDVLPLNVPLEISLVKALQDGGFSSDKGVVTADGKVLAEATLSSFETEEVM